MVNSRLEALLKPKGTFEQYSWQINTWSQLKTASLVVRDAVFAKEQHLPEELLTDEHDISAVHILVSSQENLPVGSARLVKIDKGVSQIGRVCVLLEHRGEGIARFMLTQLMQFARRRHDITVQIYAQSHSAGIFKKLGFKMKGKPFTEANISYVLMETDLLENEFAKSTILR